MAITSAKIRAGTASGEELVKLKKSRTGGIYMIGCGLMILALGLSEW